MMKIINHMYLATLQVCSEEYAKQFTADSQHIINIYLP